MSLLTKVRGLWRFDGDVDPVQVSRRSFLFMGGVVAAGLAVPAALVTPHHPFDTLKEYRLEREQRLRLLKLKVMMRDHGQPFGAQGEWLMSPNAYRELTGLDPSRVR